MSRLTRDGTAEPVSRDQILRHARGQENINFPCSADHEQDWQPYPVDPHSAICDDHTYIHTYIHSLGIFFLFSEKNPVYRDANSRPNVSAQMVTKLLLSYRGDQYLHVMFTYIILNIASVPVPVPVHA